MSKQVKKRILFIINPISGIGRQKLVETLVKNKLNHALFSAEIQYTEAPGHAIEISKEAANIYEIVAIAGGDGSVNEAGQGVTGSQSSLAILPAGSGNGLARSLGIPLNLVKAIDVINNQNIRTIDTMSVNGNVFVNMAGIGFDAHIAHLFAKHGKRGISSYLKIIFKEFSRYKGINFRLLIDGNEIEKSAFLTSIANSTQWGNNGHIAPLAEIDDGLFDICIVKRFPLIASPGLAIRLFRKTAHRSGYVEIIKAREAILICSEQAPAHYDGEPADFGKTLHIKVNPMSLNVMVP